MRKILFIASREFLATVATRGFIIGSLVTPALLALFMFGLPRFMGQKELRIAGEVAVIDPTGEVEPALQDVADPTKIEQRREARARRAAQGAYGVSGSGVATGPAFDAALTAMTGITGMTGPIPQIRFIGRAHNLAEARSWLVQPAPGTRHLAIVVVRPPALAAVVGAAATPVYDLYVPANLDARVEAVVRGMLRDAVVSVRARAHGLDLDQLDALSQVQAGRSITVARDGTERPSVPLLNIFLPLGLIMLMFIGTLGSGQMLLTTMVEEKSSRIIEVLLAAVSPLDLLAGKILGQLGAALVGMGLYVLVAFAGLSTFALFGLVEPSLLLYLILLFVISFLVFGSVMVAIGAAVEDLRDAQSLVMPFTIALAAIVFLTFGISTNPGSTLSTTLSFTPVVNTFAIMARLASTSPPAAWQVWVSIAIGIATVVGAIWFAAKIFRFALLLHGRPPNLGTLARWALSS